MRLITLYWIYSLVLQRFRHRHRRNPNADGHSHDVITNFSPAVLRTARKQLAQEKQCRYQPGGEFNAYLLLALVRGESPRGCTSARTSLEAFCLCTQDKRRQSSLSWPVRDFPRYATAQTAWPDRHLAEVLLSPIEDTQRLNNSCALPDLRSSPRKPPDGLQPLRHLDKPSTLPASSAPRCPRLKTGAALSKGELAESAGVKLLLIPRKTNPCFKPQTPASPEPSFSLPRALSLSPNRQRISARGGSSRSADAQPAP